MTEAEYLAYDLAHEGCHEFVNGDVVAMAGGSEAHALATMNVGRALGNLLAGGPCRVYSADLRVRVRETGVYAYPDVTVVYGRAELDNGRPPSLLNPRVVVEVLSDSTEAHDRGAKAAHYRRHPSVEVLVLVGTQERRVEVQVRNADGTWTLSETSEAGSVRLGPLGVELRLEEVYAGWDALARSTATE
jgi:Uma2 family endonuclease